MTIVEMMKQLSERGKYLKHKLSEVDKGLSEIVHRIELEILTDEELIKLGRKTKKLRIVRRSIKKELELFLDSEKFQPRNGREKSLSFYANIFATFDDDGYRGDE